MDQTANEPVATELHPLFQACIDANLSKVIELLPGNENIRNENGWTLLHFTACRTSNTKDRMKIIDILVEKGLNINQRTTVGPYDPPLYKGHSPKDMAPLYLGDEVNPVRLCIEIHGGI